MNAVDLATVLREQYDAPFQQSDFEWSVLAKKFGVTYLPGKHKTNVWNFAEYLAKELNKENS